MGKSDQNLESSDHLLAANATDTEEQKATPSKDGMTPEMSVKLGAAKLVCYLREQESGSLQVETASVYGTVLALPQISRSCGWPRSLINVSIRGYLNLVLNFVLQLWIVYLINKEDLIMNKFAGQMYACDFASKLATCPDGPGCAGPGGTKITPDRLYDFGTWSTRNYVRDSLHALFPHMSAEIDAEIDPGEYGIEDNYCRYICVFIFVMSLTPELNAIWDICRLMWFIPTKEESWVSYEVPDWAEKEQAKRIHSWTEMDLVKIKIAGMPLPWKVFNVLVVVLPKGLIWLSILFAGANFLLNTAGIDNVLVNSTALAFVLNIDEMVFSALTCRISQGILEKLERYPLYTVEREEGMANQEILHQHMENERKATIKRKLWSMMRIFPSNGILCVVLWVGVIMHYYLSNCQRGPDGSWVSEDLRVPRSVVLSLWQALFPSLFPIDSEEEPVWSMPPATSG